MKSVVSELFGVIAIDGKTARRTLDRSNRALHVVSAFSHEYDLVMGQIACDEKSIRKDKEVLNSSNYHRTVEKGHGRTEKRICVISEEIGWLNNKEDWAGINGIGAIYCEIEENGQKSKQSNYFIYSCKGLTAAKFMGHKRSHWSIENKLHWVLDMAFREDESRARKDNSAENFNVLRQIALNILKSEKSFKGSITDKQFKCLLDSAYLDKIVNNWICS